MCTSQQEGMQPQRSSSEECGTDKAQQYQNEDQGENNENNQSQDSNMVTVNFKWNDTSLTKQISLVATGLDMIEILSESLNIPYQCISLQYQDIELTTMQYLGSLGIQAGSEVDVLVKTQGQGHKNASQTQGLPKQIQVMCSDGSDEKQVTVLIDQSQQQKKTFMGGFNNKQLNVQYHHACSQTHRAPKYSKEDRKLSRDTQTVHVKAVSQQTFREQGTQMSKPGVLLNESFDKVVSSRPYIESETVDKWRLDATKTIQRYYRGRIARKQAAQLRKLRQEREIFLQEQEVIHAQEKENRRQKEIQRRMRPQTKEDFQILGNELEAWRLNETDKIKNSQMTEQEKKTALAQLLLKETRLLQTIDRLKIIASSENKQQVQFKQLQSMSKPKTWELRNGHKVLVHTPWTTRAKELSQLYAALCMNTTKLDERLDVLLHVKWTVKEFDCSLTREIVQLIDREADLLNRGRKQKTIAGLRKRLKSLFLIFVETPEFNPEAARFQIVPAQADDYIYSTMESLQPPEQQQQTIEKTVDQAVG